MWNATIKRLNHELKCLETFKSSYEELCRIADTGVSITSEDRPELFKWIKPMFSKELPHEKHQSYRTLFWSEESSLKKYGFYGHLNDHAADLKGCSYTLTETASGAFHFFKVKQLKDFWWCGIRAAEDLCESKINFINRELSKLKKITRPLEKIFRKV